MFLAPFSSFDVGGAGAEGAEGADGVGGSGQRDSDDRDTTISVRSRLSTTGRTLVKETQELM